MGQLYLLIPLAEGPFEGLCLADRAVFGAIWDRYRVSCYTKVGTAGECEYMDSDGEVFCYFRQDELAYLVGVSERSLRRSLVTLRERGLIRTTKVGYKGTCRYYVGREARLWLRPKLVKVL